MVARAHRSQTLPVDTLIIRLTEVGCAYVNCDCYRSDGDTDKQRCGWPKMRWFGPSGDGVHDTNPALHGSTRRKKTPSRLRINVTGGRLGVARDATNGGPRVSALPARA